MWALYMHNEHVHITQVIKEKQLVTPSGCIVLSSTTWVEKGINETHLMTWHRCVSRNPTRDRNVCVRSSH
jgi:hypothetical protein